MKHYMWIYYSAKFCKDLNEGIVAGPFGTEDIAHTYTDYLNSKESDKEIEYKTISFYSWYEIIRKVN